MNFDHRLGCASVDQMMVVEPVQSLHLFLRLYIWLCVRDVPALIVGDEADGRFGERQSIEGFEKQSIEIFGHFCLSEWTGNTVPTGEAR